MRNDSQQVLPLEGRRRSLALVPLYSYGALGPRYIHALLKEKGFEVNLIFFKNKDIDFEVIEPATEREEDLLLDLLRELKTDIVGLSVRSSFFKLASRLTHRIQNELKLPVIWGGTHATVAPEESIEVADIVCIGEGEHPLLELMERMSKGEEVRYISNLWIKADGRIFKNPLRPLLQDLDSLPIPDYSEVGKYFIEDGQITPGDPATLSTDLSVLASRGCPYQCTYCSNSVFHVLYKGGGPFVRRRKVDSVIEEIKFNRRFFPQVKRIRFEDEVFCWDREWIRQFRERYLKEVKLPIHCQTHPNVVNKEILSLLKDVGLKTVEIGLQSGSERVRLGLFNRPVTDETLLRAACIIQELKMDVYYDVIFDNPFETTEDKRKGLEFLLKLPRPFNLVMFSLTYFPKTVLTEKALAEGLISPDRVEGKAEKIFEQFKITFDYPRPAADRFWHSLFSLTSKSFLPRWFIRWVGTIGFFQEHPRPLELFAKTCNNIKLGTLGLKWLLEGRPLFALLKKRRKTTYKPIV